MKSIRPLFFFCISIGLLLACNNNDSSSGNTDNSEDGLGITVDTDSALDVSTSFVRNIQPWLNYVQPERPLSIDSFKLAEVWVEDSLVTEPFRPDSNFFALYKPFLKFSNDSAYFVDLDSYNIVLRNNNGITTGYEAGPDNQIFLVDNKNDIRKRLMFNGPSIIIQDAWWINGESLVMAGVLEPDSGKQWKPVLWKINIEENLFEKYDYTGVLNITDYPEYSTTVRFKGLNIR